MAYLYSHIIFDQSRHITKQLIWGYIFFVYYKHMGIYYFIGVYDQPNFIKQMKYIDINSLLFAGYLD